MREMVYNYEDNERQIFGEDIEEAIIQYLEKYGIPRNESENFNMRFVDVEGREISTQCLKIIW